MKIKGIITGAVMAAAMVLGVFVAKPAAATATENEGTSFNPISITPLCTESETIAKWKVASTNADPVTINWTNNDINQSGTVSIDSTTETITTAIAPDLNNTTNFIWFYHGEQVGQGQTNASNTPCEPKEPPVVCISINSQMNRDKVHFTQISKTQYSVSIDSTMPLCEDVTIYLSSYLLPDTYNNDGTFNATASPQTIISSDSVTFLKDSTVSEPVLLTVTVPDTCKATQIDLYFGPEVTTVTYPDGHGAQNIEGKIYSSTGTCNPGNGGGTTEPPVVPPTDGGGMGGGTPVAPVAPVTPAPVVVLPEAIPATGSSDTILKSLALSAIVAFMAYAAAYFLQQKVRVFPKSSL